MDAVAVGESGLQGWRAKVADATAGPVAKRTPLREEQVRALVGVAFLALSVVYVVRALKAIAAST
jgi:hypothetical protein